MGMNEAEVAVLRNELAKISKAFAEVQRLDQKIAELGKGERAPEVRAMRAAQNKIVNDTSDELIGDYQRYAKDEAIGKISTIRRRALKDRLTKTPILLRNMLLNQSEATKDSIWWQYKSDRDDYAAYRNSYPDMEEFDFHWDKKVFPSETREDVSDQTSTYRGSQWNIHPDAFLNEWKYKPFLQGVIDEVGLNIELTELCALWTVEYRKGG